MNGSVMLDIPLLGEMVAEEMRRFAQEHGLDDELWRHGEPLWIISERVMREEVFFRTLQSAVYCTSEGEYLFLMPQGLRWREDKWEVTRPDHNIRYPLSLLLPADNSKREKIKILIAYAWLVVEMLRESDVSRG